MPALPLHERQFEELIDRLGQLPFYKIGRHSDNQIIIADKKVSGHHARLHCCTPSSFLFEDLDSKNGSFINGTRVKRKVVGKNDTIRLAELDFTTEQLLTLRTNTAEDTPSGLATISSSESPNPNPELPANPLDFTRPFSDLKQVYEQYPKLRRDCRNREKMIRTGSVILSSIVGVSAVLSTGGGALPFIHIMSGAGLSVLIPTLSSTLLSTDEKLEIIDREYREAYRCPNPSCRDPFGTRDWEFLASQKICRRCQAIWVN